MNKYPGTNPTILPRSVSSQEVAATCDACVLEAIWNVTYYCYTLAHDNKIELKCLHQKSAQFMDKIMSNLVQIPASYQDQPRH